MSKSSLKTATLQDFVLANIRASQKARKRVSKLREDIREAERVYIERDSGLFPDPNGDFFTVPNEIRAITMALSDVPDEDDITPREENILLDVDGDAVGAMARVGEDTFLTAFHVVESLRSTSSGSVVGDNPHSFMARVASEEDHYFVVLNSNRSSDWAHVYTSSPLKGPIYQMAPFVPDGIVEIPYLTSGIRRVFTGPLHPIEGIAGYATIPNVPFVPGTSGLPVLHHGRLVGIFVGKQRSNGIVSLANTEYDTLSALSSAIGEVALYGKKKRVSHFVRSGKISSADYAEKIRGLTLKFGRPPHKHEIRAELEFQFQYEDEDYEDDNASRYSFEEEGYYDRYTYDLRGYVESDDGAEEGYFSENERADYDRAAHDNFVTGAGNLYFQGMAKKKVASSGKKKKSEKTPALIVNPDTNIEVIPLPRPVEEEEEEAAPPPEPEPVIEPEVVRDIQKGYNPFEDEELLAALKIPGSAQVPTPPAPAPAVKLSRKERAKLSKKSVNFEESATGSDGSSSDEEESDEEEESPKIAARKLTKATDDLTTPLIKRKLLRDTAPTVVAEKMKAYADAVKDGRIAEAIKAMPTASELNQARSVAEVESLKHQIDLLQEQGIISLEPVLLSKHEMAKYPASEHEKHTLIKQLKVLKSIQALRERRAAEKEAAQKRAIRVQAMLNSKTKEVADLKAALEELNRKAEGSDF